jgi:transcriptional regulator with XRE-family HTH domain
MAGNPGPRSPAALAAARKRAEREQRLRDLFAQRLRAARVQKGWNMSELARRATACLPQQVPGQKQGKEIGRDLVSHYERGKIRPRPEYLEALAKALDVASEELMPTAIPATSEAIASHLKIETLPDGRLMLEIKQAVPRDVGMKIINLLHET